MFFCRWTDYAIRLNGHVHGYWHSLPNSEWQNACWCVELDPEGAKALRARLVIEKDNYKQDSIAWAEAVTEFI